MSDFVRIIEHMVGKRAQIVDAPMPANEALVTYADIGKAQRLLGYNPHVSVEDGLARFWEWYQQEVRPYES
jgi:UDP-glucuronate 4-epimerase